MQRIFFPNGFGAFCAWLTYWASGRERWVFGWAMITSYFLLADIVAEWTRWRASRLAERSQIE